MRASRLLSMLLLLQTRGRMSAQALAEELEASVRTVFRDVDQLSAAGIPIWAERGRNGGFQLQEGWRTKLTGLTTDEASAIFLAGLPGPAAELGLGEAMTSAQLKLLAALPAEWQAGAQRVGTRFHLDPVDWFRNAEQWLMFQMGGIGPMFGQVGFFHKFAGREYEDKRPRDRYAAESRRLLGVLDQRLADRGWIMGDAYTIADIATFPGSTT
jgi:biotin operon repressor